MPTELQVDDIVQFGPGLGTDWNGNVGVVTGVEDGYVVVALIIAPNETIKLARTWRCLTHSIACKGLRRIGHAKL